MGTLRIVDRDFVELSNLQRQSLFDEADAPGRTAEGRCRGRKIAADQLRGDIEPVVADIDPANIEAVLRRRST